MDLPPTERTVYIHTLDYCKNNGIANVWGYFPDEKALLGYLQYSYLQEAFYKWIYGKDRLVTTIPNIPVEKIINDGFKNGKVTEEEFNNMTKQLNILKKCWVLPKDKLLMEINKFAREFNRTWYGNQQEFLYLKTFKTATDLGEFVIKANYMASTNEEFQDKIGISLTNWRQICNKAPKDKILGKQFRDILLKSLTEII